MLHAFGAAPLLPVVAIAYFVGQAANTVPIPGAVSGGIAGVLIAFGLPAAVVLPAVLAYRAVSVWLPTPIAVAALPGLRATVARWGREDCRAEASSWNGRFQATAQPATASHRLVELGHGRAVASSWRCVERALASGVDHAAAARRARPRPARSAASAAASICCSSPSARLGLGRVALGGGALASRLDGLGLGSWRSWPRMVLCPGRRARMLARAARARAGIRANRRHSCAASRPPARSCGFRSRPAARDRGRRAAASRRIG